MLMNRSTLSGTFGLACAGSMVTTRLTGMFSDRRMSAKIKVQRPPIECLIRVIGTGSSR
jgi:hypothetical protein